MNKTLHKIEFWIDKSIPFLVILIAVLISLELFYHDQLGEYLIYIEWADRIIIGIFVIDLIFKYRRFEDKKQFFKEYWLDILAVLPVYLVFRVFESLVGLLAFSEQMKEWQIILHEGLEVQKSAIIREVSVESKISKEANMAGRILRAIARSPRLLRLRVFFKHPKKHHHKKKNRNIKRKR